MDKLPTLQIKIDNKQEIELVDFITSITALNDEYIQFVTKNKKQINPDLKLYINRVSEGSIVIDLVEKVIEILPGFIPVIIDFSSFLIDTLNYLCGKEDKLPSYYNYAREDFTIFKKLVNVVANNHGNSLHISAFNFGDKIVINHNYSNAEANAIQNECNKEIKRLEAKGQSLIKEKVNLKLYQARDSVLSESKRGNLGIIEEISDKPKVLDFVTDRLRYEISKAEKNPLNFIYTVDVEIKLKEGSLYLQSHKDIKEYEILKLHGVIESSDLLSDT